MIVRRFLAWAQSAPASARAEGASALARAWLQCELAPDDRREALVAMTALLDDPAISVRQALAQVLCASDRAPRHVISMLAADQGDVALPVLAHSPLLSEAELIDCATIGEALAQCAIASRAQLPASVAAALAEIGTADAAIVLARNETAELAHSALRRLIERFWDDGAVREAILTRADLPPVLRAELVAATARALSAFVTACAWLPEERARRTTREAAERAHLIIADEAGHSDQGLADLVGHLRRSGQLTPGFLLRAVLAGHRGLCEVALGELSGLPLKRVSGLMRDHRNVGFSALMTRAGLPASIFPAMRAALSALDESGRPISLSGQVSRQVVERALTACQDLAPEDSGKVLALLRRFEAEAAVEEARAAARLRQMPPAERQIVIDLDAIEAELVEAA